MIYACGSNGCGQLGIGSIDDVSRPQAVLFEMTGSGESWPGVNHIVAGGNHTIVLLKDGTAFTAGNNDDGRCGRDSSAATTEFKKVVIQANAIEHFSDIAATWSASFFVTEDKHALYVCGSGDHGELGLGVGISSASQPRRIDLPYPMRDISSCISHTAVVLVNGEVWVWGKGRQGQVGEPREDCWSPRRLGGVDFKATRAICGTDFTCVFGEASSSDLVIFGCDRKDRFKVRSGVPSLSPWQDIAACWSSVLVHAEDKVAGWGRNDRGQLPPDNLPPVRRIAAGSEHWLVITQAGEILTGGWGEHGNCGEPTDEKGVVKGRWNTFHVEGRVENVFAGCATSFIVTTIL